MSTKVKDPDRVATGRIGAYKLHGLYDSKALTKAANAGWLSKFKREALEAAETRGEQLSEAELERRAISLRKAYMQLMALEREKRRRAAAGRNRKDATSSVAASSPAPEGVSSTSAPMLNGTLHDRSAD